MPKRSREDYGPALTCLWRGCASAAFDTPEELYKHINTVHVTQKGPCLWDECEFVGKNIWKLQNHVRTHTGEKPFKCDQCDVTLTRLDKLIAHGRTHTGEKPFKCDKCGIAFSDSSNLTKHKRTHTGEKPFTCDFDLCGAAFSDSSALTSHKRAHHTGEKPFKCDDCNAAFVQSHQLTEHKLRHHIGPWCALCGNCYVPEETMICGRCNIGQKFGAKERTFFEFIYGFDERLTECCFTLRDQSMGCGVRKRPDGLMQLQTKAACISIDQAMETVLQEDDYQIKLIIEADEHQHQAYMPSCELARLQQIQERDNDAIYVLRYNVDQPGGLEEEKLTEFCKHLLTVLDGGFLDAIDEVSLIKIEYFGYSDNRLELLKEEMRKQNEIKK